VATLETAKTLSQLGHVIDTLVYFNEVDQSMLDSFTESGIHVIQLNIIRSSSIATQLLLAYRIACTLAKGRYQLAWLQYMTPTLFPLILARFFSSKLVSTVHVASGHYNSSGLARIRWLARRWCDKFVCVSNAAADGIFGTGEVRKRFDGRVSVIPNPIDCDHVRSSIARNWRSEFGWPHEVIVIGFAGRLAHIKGPDLLLQAIALMVKEHPTIRLVFVGDGSEKTALRAQTENLGVEAITRFAGRLTRGQIYGAIKGFDIAVVPSREEGFGLSALEAMAAGVPLVASRVDALKEVVIEGETGLLFKPEDPEDLALRILSLIRDARLRQRLAEEGSAHAKRTYDLPRFHQHISSMLQRLGLGTEQTH
jgi:glycosyltransferase involved in cell wall biosynthesis